MTTSDAGTLVLAPVSSPVESDLVHELADQWRRSHPDADFEVFTLGIGEPGHAVIERLVTRLQGHDDRTVVPVRALWKPHGRRSLPAALAGFLTGRDPYRPSERLQRRLLRRDPSRVKLLTGEPATVAELLQSWRETSASTDPADFGRFVARRAVLALERAEVRELGEEYKSPRLVKPEMLASARFREGLSTIPGAGVEKAGEMLDEMATGWSRLSVDLVPALYRQVINRGFDPDFDYDTEQVEAMRLALQRHPAVLLFSHRSNLDAAALAVALQANKLPRTHTFAGINMAFGAMGPIMRRSGTIFIRRNIGDDPTYKYVLKEYVGYLAEKRFNLMWSIEGTRSRTGKMLPPKLGLLTYVADAYLDGRTEDVLLQPVSISFDQLHEIEEYADYARGGAKAPEGVAWLFNFIKAQGERNYGKIYIRFPEAVSMRKYLGEPNGPLLNDKAGKRLALHKMAIEVAWRIQRSTPINATALVSTLLLAGRGMAMTLGQVHRSLQDVLDFLERKQTPLSGSACRLRTSAGTRSALDALSGGHPITRIDDGWEPVWQITEEHQHAASFYRNSVIHAFLESSIVELSITHAVRSPTDRQEAFRAHAMRLRDLLKFDFYFADSATFEENLRSEMKWQPGLDSWLSANDDSAATVDRLLLSKRPLFAHLMLRTFIEAYRIAADVLSRSTSTTTEEELLKRSMGVGRQYVAQGRVRSAEPVSALLFGTAAKVLDDQGLLEAGPGIEVRRRAFCRELTTILEDLDLIERLSLVQFTQREADHSAEKIRREEQ